MLVFWDATIFCNNFMLPKRRFWKPGKHFGPSLWAHFKQESPKTSTHTLEIVPKQAVQNVFRGSKNLRLGSINFARWLQKIVATSDAMCWVLGCYDLLWQLCKMITKDSSNIWRDVLGFWDVMIFCNNFARWLQKIVATCDMLGFLVCYYLLWQLCKMITKDSSNIWCDVLGFWDVMIFCDNFARWLQKIVATWHVVFLVSGMLWSFVTTLQDDYKR
jgi:hypothetical protein